MYTAFRRILLRLLKAPTEPPEAPAGSHDSVQVFRASPQFLRYKLLGLTIALVIVCLTILGFVIAAFVTQEPAVAAIPAFLVVVVLPLMLLSFLLVRIDYDLRYYIVTDRSLRVREGAWTVKEMTLTYANVQNLQLNQGPLMKMFGFWDIAVETAGGGVVAGGHGAVANTHGVQLRGLENAQEVRDTILSHLRVHRAGTGLGDPDDDVAHIGARAPAAAASPAVLDALRGLRDEAATLRRAAT